jgi:hypothetical protein
MENEFQMSMMRELTFFLDIQVKQTKEDIFIHQAKYMKDLMKKFNSDEHGSGAGSRRERRGC